MIRITLNDYEDIDYLIEMFQQIGHHFPCACEEE